MDLQHCPFCGAPALLERDDDHHGEWFNLGCSQHWAATDTHCIAGRLLYTQPISDLPSAITRWNTRAPLTAAQDTGTA